MNAVDTNVLFQDKAVDLIASLTDGVPLWQVACEYMAPATL